MKSSIKKAKEQIERLYPTYESMSTIRYVVEQCGYESTQRQLGLSNNIMKAIRIHLLKLEAMQHIKEHTKGPLFDINNLTKIPT